MIWQRVFIGFAVGMMVQALSLKSWRWWLFVIAANIALAAAGRR